LQVYFQEILKHFASVGAHVVAALLKRQRINKVFDKLCLAENSGDLSADGKVTLKLKLINVQLQT
jgi:hypothetical protein